MASHFMIQMSTSAFVDGTPSVGMCYDWPILEGAYPTLTVEGRIPA